MAPDEKDQISNDLRRLLANTVANIRAKAPKIDDAEKKRVKTINEERAERQRRNAAQLHIAFQERMPILYEVLSESMSMYVKIEDERIACRTKCSDFQLAIGAKKYDEEYMIYIESNGIIEHYSLSEAPWGGHIDFHESSSIKSSQDSSGEFLNVLNIAIETFILKVARYVVFDEESAPES